MGVMTKILFGLLLWGGLTVAVLADTTPADNTGSAVTSSVQAMVDALNADIVELDFLSGKIDKGEW